MHVLVVRELVALVAECPVNATGGSKVRSMTMRPRHSSVDYMQCCTVNQYITERVASLHERYVGCICRVSALKWGECPSSGDTQTQTVPFQPSLHDEKQDPLVQDVVGWLLAGDDSQFITIVVGKRSGKRS
jgi:hypothetical protein